MKSRLVTAAALALVALVALTTSGCLPQPAPEPSSAFASEAEAFAAAEETYRAYVDAVNERRRDPSASVDPASFLIADALEEHIATQQQLDQAGLRVIGDTTLLRVDPVAFQPADSTVTIAVCLDSAETQVLDSAGTDVTPSDRETRTALQAQLTRVGNDLRIEASDTVSSPAC